MSHSSEKRTLAARIGLRAIDRWDCWLAVAADGRMSHTEKMMVHRGHVKNGKIMLDGPLRLREGAEVSVECAMASLS